MLQHCKAFIAVAMVSCIASVARCEDFYHGKTIKIIVSTGPGGGYDAYGRLLTRYM